MDFNNKIQGAYAPRGRGRDGGGIRRFQGIDTRSQKYSNAVKLLTKMKSNLNETLNELNYIKVRTLNYIDSNKVSTPKTCEPEPELPKIIEEEPENTVEMVEQPVKPPESCKTEVKKEIEEKEETEVSDVAGTKNSCGENQSVTDSEESIESDSDPEPENDFKIFCIDPLHQAVLSDLHPQVTFDEVKQLLADVNLIEVDDLTLVNNQADSHSIVTFPSEDMLRIALSFHNKLTHKGRLIKVRRYTTKEKPKKI